jgi:hypothetical protein
MNFQFPKYFTALREAMQPATYEGATPKARNVRDDQRNKTKKGATHIVRPAYRSRQNKAMTPAMYRRAHKGVITIVPNYLQKHAAPKGRNVWISQL